MASSRVLLLMTPTTYRATDFLAAAEAAGLEIVVGTNRAQTLAGLAPAHNLTLPFDDPALAVARSRAYAGRFPVDAVVGVDDESVVVAAHVASALGLPHNSIAAVGASRSKAAMRQALTAAGMPMPPFLVADQCPDAHAVAEACGFPCVIKPASLSGSRGVLRLDRPCQLPEAWRRVRGIIEAALAEGRQGIEDTRLLFEGYLPGPEVAVEALLEAGRLRLLAVLDKPDPMEGPTFAETLFITPSRHGEATVAALSDLTARAATALGLQDGPIHAEFRLGGTKPALLELAPRTIGGLCSRALRFSTGMSLEEIVLRQACRRPLPDGTRSQGAGGVLMLPVTAAGTLRGVEGLEEARQVEGIEEVTISIPSGEQVRPLPEESRVLGFVFARGATAEAVEGALRRAWARLKVDIEALRS